MILSLAKAQLYRQGGGKLSCHVRSQGNDRELMRLGTVPENAHDQGGHSLQWEARAVSERGAIMTFGLGAHCHGCAVTFAVRRLSWPARLMTVTQAGRDGEPDGT